MLARFLKNEKAIYLKKNVILVEMGRKRGGGEGVRNVITQGAGGEGVCCCRMIHQEAFDVFRVEIETMDNVDNIF